MDGRGHLCRVTGYRRDAGSARPGDAAGVPHPCGAGGDDLARCSGVHQGGVGWTLSGALAGRTGSAFAQADHADGCATVQDPCDGTAGDLGASAGLQLAPRGYGPGRPTAGDVATPGEPIRGTPDAGSLSQSIASAVPYAT